MTKRLGDGVRGHEETVADQLEREPVTIEDGRFVNVRVAELRTRSTPRDTVAFEMSEHRRAVDVEASCEPEYRVAIRVCGNEPLDVSGSEPDLGLAVTACEPAGGLRVEVSSAPRIANSLVTSETCTTSLPGFESRPIRSSRLARLPPTCLLSETRDRREGGGNPTTPSERTQRPTLVKWRETSRRGRAEI
jgi:hypothetical protein